MSRCIYTRSGQRTERLAHLPATRIQRTGHSLPPSRRIGARWASLPVEGSKAWRDRQPLLSRIFTR